MLLNLRENFQRNRQSAASIFERNNRIAACPNRLQKRPYLCPQRLFLFDRRLNYFDLRIRTRLALVSADREYHHILPSIINRDILPRLKKPQLADPLGRNPAGGKVRYASGFKLYAGIGNV